MNARRELIFHLAVDAAAFGAAVANVVLQWGDHAALGWAAASLVWVMVAMNHVAMYYASHCCAIYKDLYYRQKDLTACTLRVLTGRRLASIPQQRKPVEDVYDVEERGL